MPDLEDAIEIMEQQAIDKAHFCLKLDIAPSEYDQLTLIERNMFIKVAKEIKKDK